MCIRLISTMNRTSKSGCDWELPSEPNEPPINPLLIHIIAPFVGKNISLILQVNGEELWKRREVTFPKMAFNLIQNCIWHLGYQFEASSQDCVGRAIAEKIRKFKRKMESITNGKKRTRVRAETWVKLSIKINRMRLNRPQKMS